MTKEKTAAFLFYPSDWLADMKVAGMTLAQKGAYVDLLCYQWREGHLPSEERQIMGLLRLRRPGEFAPVWSGIESMFPICDDGLRRNRRLEVEKTKWETKRQTRRKSAETRWGGDANASGMHMHNASSTSTRSSTRDQRENTPPLTPPPNESAAGSGWSVQQIWLEKTGNIEWDLLGVKQRIEAYAENRGEPATGELAGRVIEAFVNWAENCSPGRKPGLAPMKFCERWAQVQEVLNGKRKVNSSDESVDAKLERARAAT